LKIRFHKRQVSFLLVKTVKCKRDTNLDILPGDLFLYRLLIGFSKQIQ